MWEEYPKPNLFRLKIGRWYGIVKETKASWGGTIWKSTFADRSVRGGHIGGCPGYFRTLEDAKAAVLREAKLQLAEATKMVEQYHAEEAALKG